MFDAIVSFKDDANTVLGTFTTRGAADSCASAASCAIAYAMGGESVIARGVSEWEHIVIDRFDNVVAYATITEHVSEF